MYGRRLAILASVVATAVLLTIGGYVVARRVVTADASPADTLRCQKAVRTAEAKIRTDRWDPPEEMPDLGDYLEIHWQTRALGNPCSRVPGPTDWAYQGVVKLRPEDARTLATRYDFVPFPSIDPAELKYDSTPASAWPALVPLLPARSRWLHSTSYNDQPPSKRWRVAFLDVEHQTLATRATIAVRHIPQCSIPTGQGKVFRERTMAARTGRPGPVRTGRRRARRCGDVPGQHPQRT